MIISTYQYLNSITEIASYINKNTENEPEVVAAHYAKEAVMESEWPLNEKNIEPHLDALVENGAKFNYSSAMQLALA
jgi:hypothetical protein